MFEFNDFWLVAPIMWGIILIVALTALRRTRERFDASVGWYRHMRVSARYRIVSMAAWFVGLALVLNAGSWGLSWATSESGEVVETTYDSGVYPTESFGLTPGESYPMSLGQLGFSSSIDIRRSPFYFSFQERSGATSIISVTHEDDTYILEIPVRVTTYHQVEGVEPSMQLFFNTGNIQYERNVMGQWQTTRTDTYESCHSQFTNLLWTCMLGELVSSKEETEGPSQEQIEDGLTYWVEKYLDRAEITLTPEMHDELIGKIG
jgi:hypothetical protein